MADQEKIKQAVAKLDRKNDNDWTNSGLPNVHRVSEIVGEPVTRDDINKATNGELRAPPAEAGAAASRGGRFKSDAAKDVPDHGGGVVFDDRDGDLVEADAGSEMRATKPRRKELEDDFDGPEPDEVFDMLNKISAAASSPRWRRNQVVQQIKALWASGQSSAVDVQKKLERRSERRIEHRERVKADRESSGAEQEAV